MHPKIALAALAFTLALGTESAFGQSRLTGADLDGAVVDESGAAVPGANVSVRSLDTNVTRTAASDGKGRHTVAALPPGRYRISVSLSPLMANTPRRWRRVRSSSPPSSASRIPRRADERPAP
jgi:hypothetical protein